MFPDGKLRVLKKNEECFCISHVLLLPYAKFEMRNQAS